MDLRNAVLAAFEQLRAGHRHELRYWALSHRRAQPRVVNQGRSLRAAPPRWREAEHRGGVGRHVGTQEPSEIIWPDNGRAGRVVAENARHQYERKSHVFTFYKYQ